MHKPIRFATRLSIAFMLLLLIPLLGITFLNYRNFRKTTLSQTLDLNERSLKQTSAYLNYTLSSLNNIIDTLSFDETIQSVLKTESQYDRAMEGNWFLQRTDVLNIIYNPYTTNELQSVRVYPLEGPSRFSQTESYKQLGKEGQQAWDERIQTLELFKMILIPSSLFTGEYPNTISLVKRVPDFNSINKYIGMIKGDIPQHVFQAIVGQTAASKGSTTLLFNSYGELIAHVGDEALKNVETIKQLLAEQNIALDGSLTSVHIGEESFFIGGNHVDLSDWQLVCLIPENQVLSAATAYRSQMFWMVLALFIATVPLSFYTTKTVTNRIRKLQHHIGQSQEKGFDIVPLENGTDEIGELTIAYDTMASNLRDLLEEQFQQGYQIKDLEIKVLQSTIDPHFLYNTLDLMSWKALQKHDTESANLAKALSKFYKLSLGHGQTIVPLRCELEHVRTYVEIQNMRFDGKITLSIMVPVELQDYMVFKIMLQPIVENAILHGIRERKDETGTIWIRARKLGDSLTITVADNGVGMQASQMETLLTLSDEHTGYGVWNIHERIRLAHGDSYGLRFYSKPNTGTVVSIVLPLSLTSFVLPTKDDA